MSYLTLFTRAMSLLLVSKSDCSVVLHAEISCLVGCFILFTYFFKTNLIITFQVMKIAYWTIRIILTLRFWN